jgi:pimeloyl-ACP methyl ester carboxylesterase
MTSFLLIPGAGGSAWYWHLVVRELADRGQEALAVDLPADDDSAGFAEYADVAVAAAGERRGLVVVGQSMGGFTAPLVCDRLSARLLVLLNAMTPLPGESGGQWWANTGSRKARQEQADRDGRALDDDPQMTETFFHDVPDAVREEAFARGEPDQSETPFVKPWPLKSWPDVPTRFLAATGDRLFPIEFQRRVVAERLGIPVDEMPGGHLVALSRPVEVAERLIAYAIPA